MKYYFSLFFLILISCVQNVNHSKNKIEPKKYNFSVSTGANSWVINGNNKLITKAGITNWIDENLLVNTYVRIENEGDLDLGVSGSGSGKLIISLANQSKAINLESSSSKQTNVGTFSIAEPGYYAIQLKKEPNSIFNIDSLYLGGKATENGIIAIKDDIYFGRRGPSVHLSYQSPENKEVLYFYNEIRVPKGEDVIGSYFMANGFAEGYFGIQVNSETERRILFSVWSPYKTDNPNEIPKDYRVIALKSGEGVKLNDFGNEGSGGQSYTVYPWKSETTYRFLMKGEPSENNSTDYTAYFYSPTENQWKLIASFRRPHTTTYLKRLHSFLENFNPATGYLTRKANYQNQWVFTTENQWIELTNAKFTADATANKKARMDYAGGVEKNVFYLKNCGFFNETTELLQIFKREPNGQAPSINFDKLP